jgi:hypothetical protein
MIAEVTVPTPPTPRRRMAIATVVVLALLGGLLVHRAATGQLLSTGDGYFPDSLRYDHPTDTNGFAVQVVYRHRAPYTFTFTLENKSILPVKVVSFPSKTWGGLLVPDSVSVDGGESRSMSPFTIAPRGTARVEARMHFGHCVAFGPKTGATLVSLPIRYRALWFTRTRFVDLPAGIHVDAPDSCPGTAWE